MAKVKTTFFCQNCGAQSAKWIGKCPSCGEWNTYVEEVIEKPGKGAASRAGSRSGAAGARPRLISEIRNREEERFASGNQELDRVLGGGIVPGVLVLVGGEPAAQPLGIKEAPRPGGDPVIGGAALTPRIVGQRLGHR